MDITQLEVGGMARVLEIRGGQMVQKKLHDIGIVPGRTVAKTTQALLRGPVVLNIGTTRVAIGFGMARKIVIEPLASAL